MPDFNDTPATMEDLRDTLFAKGSNYLPCSDEVLLGHAIADIRDMRRALGEFGMTYDTKDCHWYSTAADWWEETATKSASSTACRLNVDERLAQLVEERPSQALEP